ncbi:Iron-sulfur assembly protein 1 [Orobanche hederae]
MELQLLYRYPIPYYCPPKFTSKKSLRWETKLNFGVPSKSFESTGTNAYPFVVLNNASERGGSETALVVEKPSVKQRRFEVFSGHTPFGATARDGGVNFAVFSSNASLTALCLISLSDLPEKRVSEQIDLNPVTNRTGDVWHVFLKGDLEDMVYGYKFDGSFSPEDGLYFNSSKVLIDPYGKAVLSRGEYGALGPDKDCWPQMACLVPSSNDEFDWEGDLPLKFPQRDLIIYEMHVRGFTRHESSNLKNPGTYLGVAEKLDYLKKLGVNCIELMPCHEFNELEYYSYNSVLGDYKMNYWGYSTINFFSPMARYSSAGIANYGLGAVNEFKYLVRETHKHGIEVIMDVVFNHTAEGNENGPTLSFRGLDNSVFYMLAPKGEYYNYSGCGNTFNCNHPVVRQFIVDCLRYWVIEMHVDGFRFDLASILTRSSSLWDAVNVYGSAIEGDIFTTGTPLPSPPLIDMISNDPILHGVKDQFRYDDFKADTEVKVGLYKTIERMYPNVETRIKIDEQLEKFRRGEGMFGMSMATATRDRKLPGLWWESYGEECKELQELAIRSSTSNKRKRGPRNLNAITNKKGKQKMIDDDEVEYISDEEEEEAEFVEDDHDSNEEDVNDFDDLGIDEDEDE